MTIQYKCLSFLRGCFLLCVLAVFTGCPADDPIICTESAGLSFSFDIKNESSNAKSITLACVFFFENIPYYGYGGPIEKYSNHSFEAGKNLTVYSDRVGAMDAAIYSFLLTIDGEIYAGWREEDKHPDITSEPVKYELGYLITKWDEVSQLFPYISKLRPENDKRRPVSFETHVAYRVIITDEDIDFVLETIENR